MSTQVFADTLDTLDASVGSLSSSFNTSIFEIASVILATAVVLFLTLVLIPIQQCAATYSPSLLKYLRRDKLAIVLVLFLIGCLFFNIYMLFIEPTRALAFVSAALLLVSFIVLILMFYRVTRMLNPAEYLLPKIKDDCIKTLKRGLRKPKELTNEETLMQLDQQTKKAMLIGEKIDPKDPKWAVPWQVIDQVLEKMRPLKTVTMKFISASDYEAFENALGKIKHISIEYFKQRRDYKNADDDFLFSLCETMQDIARTANRDPNVYFSRCVFASIKDIAFSTLYVKVYGHSTGRNDLTHPFSGILRDSAEASVLKGDRDRAYDAAKNLGHVAQALAARDFSFGATEIASELVQVARLCHVTRETIVPVPIRRSLAEIFFLVIYGKRLRPLYDLPYEKLIEAYEIMINIPVATGVDLTEGDSLFGWNPDLTRDRSLSALVYASLFSPNHDDDSINHNLDGVEAIIGFLQKHHDKDIHTGWRFTDLLYQIGLWLFAFIDKDIQMELTLLPTGMIPAGRNQKKAKGILIELLKYLLITYFECVNGQSKNILRIGNVLHAPLSLLYLALHWDRIHSLGLNEDMDAILALLEQKIEQLTSHIDYGAYEHFQTLCEFLKRINKLDRANTISQKTRAVWNEKYATSSLDIPRIIKRPIVAFNYNFISQLDTEIFGGQNRK